MNQENNKLKQINNNSKELTTTTSVRLLARARASSSGKLASQQMVKEKQEIASSSMSVKKPSGAGRHTVLASPARSHSGSKSGASLLNHRLSSAKQHSIKKSGFKSDDYLDLNEESMRISCKRLMNHLYSESSGSQASDALKQALSLDLISESELTIMDKSGRLLLPAEIDHSPLPSLASSGTMAAGSRPGAVKSGAHEHRMVPASATSTKSYLRSQYERRQLRQLELMNKMQPNNSGSQRFALPTAVNAVGANVCRQQQQQKRSQQQDLVAKSHELSKRRFFEKLERRESMKNSVSLSTPGNKPDPSASKSILAAKSGELTPATSAQGEAEVKAKTETARAKATCPTQAATIEEDEEASKEEEENQTITCENLDADKRTSLAASFNLTTVGAQPKFVPKLHDQLAAKRNANEDTHGASFTEATGAEATKPTKAEHEPFTCLDGQLIGFSSRQHQKQQTLRQPPSRLIEISETPNESSSLTKLLGHVELEKNLASKPPTAIALSGDDESSFEITVLGLDGLLHEPMSISATGCEATAATTTSGFISSGLLVVKQVPAEIDAPNMLAVSFDDEQAGADLRSSGRQSDGEKTLMMSLERSNKRASHWPAARDAKSENASSGKADICSNNSTNRQSLDDENEQINGQGSETIDLAQPAEHVNLTCRPTTKTRDIQHQEWPVDAGCSTISSKGGSKILTACNDGSGIKAIQSLSSMSSLDAATANKQETTSVYEPSNELARVCPDTLKGSNGARYADNARSRADIEDEGESNCTNDHEGPETEEHAVDVAPSSENKQVVQQSSVAVSEDSAIAKCGDPTYFAKIANTAQAQQADLNNQQTTTTAIITKPGIRDVLPQASGINRKEPTIVREAEKLDGKVIVIPKQVNEVHRFPMLPPARPVLLADSTSKQNRLHPKREPSNAADEYANSQREGSSSSDIEIEKQNNVEMKRSIGSKDNGPSEAYKSQLIDTRGLNLIQKHNNLQQPQQHRVGRSSSEEDGGSCSSSSGFGASVSVTSGASLDTCKRGGGLTDSLDKGIVSIGKRSSDEYKRPNSLAVAAPSEYQNPITVASRNNVPIYESMCALNRSQKIRTSQLEDEFPDYKQLVGPDQAYPKKNRNGRMLLVENHGYASIVNRCDTTQKTVEDPSCLYANLRSRVRSGKLTTDPPIEYATVGGSKLPLIGGLGIACADDNLKVKRNISVHGCKSYASDGASSSSNRSNSSDDSMNSGGFSGLPPAPQHTNLGPTSTCQTESLETSTSPDSPKQNDSGRKSSLLRRFGSLVSRAFSGGPTSEGSQSEERVSGLSQGIKNENAGESVASENQCSLSKQRASLDGQMKNKSHHSDHPSLDLKILKNPDESISRSRRSENSTAFEQPDLVILPTKKFNRCRRAPRASPRRREVHDRPSRVKIRTRNNQKLTGSGSTSLSSVCSSSSSLSTSGRSSACSSISEGGRRGRRRWQRRRHQKRRTKNQHPRRADSLSGELESMMVSPKEVDRSITCHRVTAGRQKNLGRHFEIDCTLPSNKAAPAKETVCLELGRGDKIPCSSSSNPKSILRIFNSKLASDTKSRKNMAESEPDLVRTGSKREDSLRLKNNELSFMTEEGEHKSASGFWGLTSLIGHNNESKERAKSRTKGTTKRHDNFEVTPDAFESNDHDISIYSNVQPQSIGYKLYSSLALSAEQEQQQQISSAAKYQSLSLYQNLLRNYTKRRHHKHGSRDHEHRHHHHHHRHSTRNRKTSSLRRTHHQPERRCAEKSCQLNESSSCHSHLTDGSTGSSHCKSDRAPVWGQLVKINKQDGTQVIELQRSPGRSWGFFVVRGYINNVKGIFISRMHDSITSNSLAGLLSLGDRILAIDDSSIEPDYDILRVNQLMSKKSKIMLKVKPFKA